jgi:hypothetical protein
MSRRCPVYASYLKRYGTSMKHVRDNSETFISQDVPVLLIASHFAFGRLKQFSFESTRLRRSRPAAVLRQFRNAPAVVGKNSAFKLVQKLLHTSLLTEE